MKSKVIIHDLDMAVPTGTIMGLVGPNGAGKTTTIKLGSGLLEPQAGKVLIKGHSATDTQARSPLGLLTESQYIYPHLRLKEWLIMLAGISGLKENRRLHRVNEVMELLELTDRGDQMMRTLSKGQVQRAGLAQALVHEPAILLLDEPMSGLDPYWRYRLQKILLDFKSAGGTILFSSHILSDMERLSDQVALLEDGRLCWMGRLADLPRKNKGYEAVCATRRPEILKNLAIDGSMEPQPEGRWLLIIPGTQRDDLLKLASAGTVTLESLRPIREEIDEVLFGFTAGPSNLHKKVYNEKSNRR